MKRFFALFAAVLMAMSLAACAGNNKTPQSGATSAQSGATSAQSDNTEKFMVKLADGREKEAVLTNGFYSFAVSELVKLKAIEYQTDQPQKGFARLKLVLEGNSENTIVFMVKKSLPHGDYSSAWENAEYIAYSDQFNENNLFGENCEWEMPEDLSEYELRVFDDKTAEHAVEIGFLVFKK